MNNRIHPEVLKEVNKEFQRLHKKYPNTDGQTKWDLARDYVWALSSADTAIFNEMYVR